MSHLTQWRCNSTERRWRQSQPHQWCRAPSTTRFTTLTLSESYKIINASDAWTAAGGRATAGAGIKIGDIDSGIDNTHPFFDPDGFSYPPGFPKCDAADSASHHEDQDCNYVSEKVIVAKVFYQ